MNLTDKKVLVYDGGGLFVSLALRLAATKAFAQVDYFRDWQDGFCDGRELIIGSGLEPHGVGRLKYFWFDPRTQKSPIDDYDLFIFPDCWHGDTQEYLRSIGKRVWGTGFQNKLELARWGTKELIEKIGLPPTDSEQIEGLDNLRTYLKEHDGVFVKISAYRGIGETFESDNYRQSQGQCDELRAKYGDMMDITTFIAEKKIPDAEEVGYDGYCIDGEFPNSSFYGWEDKDKAYFGKLVDYDDLPDDVQEANTRLSFHMAGYRQFWSTELRDGKVIDITARHASPGGEAFIQAADNLPEILWHGAEGILVHAQWSAKYAAQVLFCSEWAEEHTMRLFFPEEIRPFIKIYHHCIIKGIDCCIPQLAKMKQVGSVIGLGNTPQEAAKAARDRAKQIKGYDLEMETDALDKLIAEHGKEQ